ncbi:hypothetical protein J2Y58_000240 [Sphingomonas sp. BE138]|nr:hypothetical protein [Sphingomonas sp. BE138]
MNGSKLLPENAGSAKTTNTASATILIATSTMLKVALSFVPATSMPAIPSATSTAGRFTMPPACGPDSRIAGIFTPTLCNQPTRYADQPTATVEQASEYSRIRLHPTIQAMLSPITE